MTLSLSPSHRHSTIVWCTCAPAASYSRIPAIKKQFEELLLEKSQTTTFYPLWRSLATVNHPVKSWSHFHNLLSTNREYFSFLIIECGSIRRHIDDYRIEERFETTFLNTICFIRSFERICEFNRIMNILSELKQKCNTESVGVKHQQMQFYQISHPAISLNILLSSLLLLSMMIMMMVLLHYFHHFLLLQFSRYTTFDLIQKNLDLLGLLIK